MIPTTPALALAPVPFALAAGNPCWLELTTATPATAMSFYQAVMDWDFEQRVDSHGLPYYVATVDGEPVAGIRPVDEPDTEWTVYLATTDLDDLVRRSETLGGYTVETGHVVPRVGAKAVILSPAGARYGACQIAPDWSFATGESNSLVWVEFITHFASLADEYFGELFGFSGRQFGDGGDDDYMVWYAEEDSVIGRCQMMPGTPTDVPARWIAHFRTSQDRDFDSAVRVAHDAGARLRFRPYTSSLGKVAVLSDPCGAKFALIDPELAMTGGGTDDPFDD
jgi:predicted enzyme related to lactoylglutathione lyase